MRIEFIGRFQLCMPKEITIVSVEPTVCHNSFAKKLYAEARNLRQNKRATKIGNVAGTEIQHRDKRGERRMRGEIICVIINEGKSGSVGVKLPRHLHKFSRKVSNLREELTDQTSFQKRGWCEFTVCRNCFPKAERIPIQRGFAGSKGSSKPFPGLDSRVALIKIGEAINSL